MEKAGPSPWIKDPSEVGMKKGPEEDLNPKGIPRRPQRRV